MITAADLAKALNVTIIKDCEKKIVTSRASARAAADQSSNWRSPVVLPSPHLTRRTMWRQNWFAVRPWHRLHKNRICSEYHDVVAAQQSTLCAGWCFGSWGNSATIMWCTVHPCDLQNLHIGGVISLDDHSPILLLYADSVFVQISFQS